MDFFDLGCSALEISLLKPFFDAAGLLGRGITAPLIGASILLYGYLKNDSSFKRLGLAVLIDWPSPLCWLTC
jgi:hypothetical protein